MALQFPNRSRSYDDTARRIRFSGYDGMAEISFFMEAGAFFPPTAAATERELLAAFDEARTSVYEAAQKAYARDRKNRHILTSADLR
ncbi:DUF1488 family protein [Mesorhizobium sp. YR577]|jgi:hypothetical protein|uniref:DUF1488 family protein n=1 Tax=Mesorhizobium sp. YR577 TaxID=1884373 RepID=UPI0008E0151E|nr:DUF1488 family protein [Mesorhizobium sp. YR577]SFT44174.1 Protein of unknown function [Mesorhizobium sp. YR577]